jgi:hypothetical protein
VLSLNASLIFATLISLPQLSVKIYTSACHLLHTGFMLCLFFDPEDEGDMFLWKLRWLSTEYIALYP